MSEREQFEKWAVLFGLSVKRRWHDEDRYLIHEVQVAWESWQAAKSWQPIALAPKDGTRVYAWHPEWQYPEVVRWFRFAWMDEDGRVYFLQPTMFCYLPEPPKE